jgi:hypothetical protein
MFKLDLDMFISIMNSIDNHRKDNETLTKTLIKQSVGIIDYSHEIISNLTYMLSRALNDEDNLIEWWLYESISPKIIKEDNTKYDVSDVKDLYYYLNKEYNKVKQVM